MKKDINMWEVGEERAHIRKRDSTRSILYLFAQKESES